MIKSRRTTTRVQATGVDRQVAKGKAKRSAAANARRGLATTAQPTAKEIEMEVVRQTRRATSSTKKLKDQQQQQAPVRGRKPRSQADIKTKARQEKKAGTPNKKQAADNAIPPTWIGGTRRPPSKKAVTAAVEAMQQSGFKVPKGMQMVISFAPAPDNYPTGNNEFGGNTSANKKQPNSNSAKKTPNANSNSAKKSPNTNSNNNTNGGGGRRGGGRRN